MILAKIWPISVEYRYLLSEELNFKQANYFLDATCHNLFLVNNKALFILDVDRNMAQCMWLCVCVRARVQARPRMRGELAGNLPGHCTRWF